MSSLKNAIPRRKYRERGQLKKREYLGFLEKKQDYKHRAINYHEKEDKINKLREKASLKNPDEFYHRMINAKTEDGKHIDIDEDDIVDTKEYRKILKTKNQNAVKLQNYRDLKKIQEMKANLQMIDGPKLNKKKLFFDNYEELQNFNNNKKSEGYLPETLEKIDLEKEANLKQISSKMKQNYKKLADKIENQEKMQDMYLKLDYEKNLLNGERKKIKKYKTGKIHKFFKQRKT